jgi:hypothetical protein
MWVALLPIALPAMRTVHCDRKKYSAPASSKGWLLTDLLPTALLILAVMPIRPVSGKVIGYDC